MNFIPHIGIEEQPSAPFTKDTCATNASCAGYSMPSAQGFDGKVFDNANANAAKFVFFDDATQGTYFRSDKELAKGCSLLQGKMDGEKCNITKDQVKSFVDKHQKVEKFCGCKKESFCGCNKKENFCGYKKDDDCGCKWEYNHRFDQESFVANLLKAVLIIGILIVILKMINKKK